jgi:hypothetical protein
MRIYTQKLLLILSLGVFAFTATSGWASLRPAAAPQSTPAMQSSHAPTAHKSQMKTESISGTIVKSGSQYVLRASNGQEYQLSNASRAQAYVGKSVTVTGKVNASSHVIDVQSIQPQ